MIFTLGIQQKYNERAKNYRMAFIHYLGGTCVGCGETDINKLSLHHISYTPPEYEVACQNPCHQRAHRDDFIRGGRITRNLKEEFYPRGTKEVLRLLKEGINARRELIKHYSTINTITKNLIKLGYLNKHMETRRKGATYILTPKGKDFIEVKKI